MAKQIETFISAALQRGLVSQEQAEQLRGLARSGAQDVGLSKMTVVFSILGGAIILAGLILLIASNWDSVSDSAKIGGLVALLFAAHGGGLWLNARHPDYAKTAEALHLIGGGLFMAGIALVSQIYHLDGNIADALLTWLIAVAPLAYLLRSPSLVVMSLFITLLWSNHLVRPIDDGWFYLEPLFWSNVDFNAGWALAFIGLSPLLGRWHEGLGRFFARLGIVMTLIYIVLFGFAKDFSTHEMRDTLVPWPWLVQLWVVAAGLAAAVFRPSRRPQLNWAFAGLVVLFVIATLWFAQLRLGLLSDESFTNQSWSLAILAWLLHIGFGMYAIVYGSMKPDRWSVNVGVWTIGLFVLLRFIGLIGTMNFTGFAFIFGGLILILSGVGLERWRRTLLAKVPA